MWWQTVTRSHAHSGRRRAAFRVLGCVLAAASGLVWSTGPAGVTAAPHVEVTCETPNVVVRSPEYADAVSACEGALDALTFLASQGLVVTSDIRIEVVAQLPAAIAGAAAGCYLESQGKVLILAYTGFKARGTWLGVPANRTLYRSLVAHEVAHSVAACNFTVRTPSVQAKEYIAYVTMFATMPPAQRDEILSRHPGKGFEGDWQISAVIFFVEPVHFGAQAYRHFLKLPDGRDYLHEILAGRVLAK